MILLEGIKILDRIKALGCDVLCDQPLAPYTSFKIGGNAKMVVKPSTIAAIQPLLTLLKSQGERYCIIGNGSNMLVSSNGYDGTVIVISDALNKIEVQGRQIICEAGATLTRLCRAALESQLHGLEFAYGIPGTVGGSIYMNAGAYGGEIKDVLKSCTFIDENGEMVTLPVSELDLSYRHSIFTGGNCCILSAEFELEHGDADTIRTEMDKYLASRKEKQPLEYPSAGSTFKRPDGNYASALIEQCGLKGCSVGGAMVSTKHSGFVINTGGATSDDVLKLVEHIKAVVYEKTGYNLECEIQML